MSEDASCGTRCRSPLFQSKTAAGIAPAAVCLFFSLATVYRNLALFKEEGQVISVAVVDGEERFDADVTPHGHFICESCGLVEDLHFEHFAEWEREVELQTHARVEYYSILFYGLCPSCRREMRS